VTPQKHNTPQPYLCHLWQRLPCDELWHVCVACVMLELKHAPDGPCCGVTHVGVGVFHGLQSSSKDSALRNRLKLTDTGTNTSG
jgi:hypothetical protein